MAADRRKEPIWPFVIPAVVLATAWAALMVFASSEVLDDHAGDTAYLIGYFGASAVLPCLLIWGVFYLLFFRPRAAIGKSLQALGVMCGLTFGLQFAPLAAVNAVRGDQRAAQLYLQQSGARVTALSDHVGAQLDALDLPGHEAAGIQSKPHVAAWLAHMREAATVLEAYDAALATEASAAETELAGMRLPDSVRAQYVAELESALGRDGLPRRVNAARIGELRKASEALAVLADHPDAWTIEGGVPAFYDAALLERYRALGSEVQALRRERIRLEDEMAASASAQQDHRREPQEGQEANRVGDEGDEHR